MRGAALPEPRGGAAVVDRDYGHGVRLDGTHREGGRAEPLKGTGFPFDRALRLFTTLTLTSEPQLQLAAPTVSAIAAGDVIHVRFWLRCHDSMSGEGYTTFAFEPVTPDATRPVEFR